MATSKAARHVRQGEFVFAENKGFIVVEKVDRGREIDLIGKSKRVTLAADALVLTRDK
ncbi:hypothetical protein [Allokutzneria oryzae]|uniref:Preprotein translocase subunit YajC n=1 Tax=Allokutzneria oryzae TaxID=1378989 RepID=A0ABV5ZZK4_9PSEU